MPGPNAKLAEITQPGMPATQVRIPRITPGYPEPPQGVIPGLRDGSQPCAPMGMAPKPNQKKARVSRQRLQLLCERIGSEEARFVLRTAETDRILEYYSLG